MWWHVLRLEGHNRTSTHQGNHWKREMNQPTCFAYEYKHLGYILPYLHDLLRNLATVWMKSIRVAQLQKNINSIISHS